MKKKLSVLMAVILVVACLLVGCGGKDMSSSKYCGTWIATTGEYAGISISVTDTLGECKITFNDDGSCDLDLAGETTSGSWDESDTGVVIDGDSDMTFEDQDGALVVDYDGVIMTFEKQ